MNEILPLPMFPGVSDAQSNFDSTRQSLRSKPFYVDIDLSVARLAGSMLNLPIAGNVIYIDQKQNSGIARIHFQDQTPTSTPITVYPGFMARIPFTQIAIENDAQAGVTMRLIFGTDLDFLPNSTSANNAARPAWYDRNPISKGFNYAGALVVPHGAAVRFTYTVPAGRKAVVEAASVEILRDGVAGVAGRASNTINLTCLDASVAQIVGCDNLLNTVGAVNQVGIGGSIAMVAGESLAAVTADPSTTGTFTLRCAAKVTEYDA